MTDITKNAERPMIFKVVFGDTLVKKVLAYSTQDALKTLLNNSPESFERFDNF